MINQPSDNLAGERPRHSNAADALSNIVDLKKGDGGRL